MILMSMGTNTYSRCNGGQREIGCCHAESCTLLTTSCKDVHSLNLLVTHYLGVPPPPLLWEVCSKLKKSFILSPFSKRWSFEADFGLTQGDTEEPLALLTD